MAKRQKEPPPSFSEPGRGHLRICHSPQIPCKPFEVFPLSLEEAKKIMDILAQYDLFQFKNKIKPDYSNITTLEMWGEKEKEWLSWEDDEGREFDEYCRDKNFTFPGLCTITNLKRSPL